MSNNLWLNIRGQAFLNSQGKGLFQPGTLQHPGSCLSCCCGCFIVGGSSIGGRSPHIKMTVSGFPILGPGCRNNAYAFPNGFNFNGTYCVPYTGTNGEFISGPFGQDITGPACLYQLPVTGQTLQYLSPDCSTVTQETSTFYISILSGLNAMWMEVVFAPAKGEFFDPAWIVGVTEGFPFFFNNIDCGQSTSLTLNGDTTGAVGYESAPIGNWAEQWVLSPGVGFTPWGGTITLQDGGC